MNPSTFAFTLDGTVSKPAIMAAPASWPMLVYTDAYSPGTEQPVFSYLGNDGGYYTLLPFATSPTVIRADNGQTSDNSTWDYIKSYFGYTTSGSGITSLSNNRPLGTVEPALNNFLELSQDTTVSNGAAALKKDLSFSGLFTNEPDLLGVSGFVNPKMYFMRRGNAD